MRISVQIYIERERFKRQYICTKRLMYCVYTVQCIDDKLNSLSTFFSSSSFSFRSTVYNLRKLMKNKKKKYINRKQSGIAMYHTSFVCKFIKTYCFRKAHNQRRPTNSLILLLQNIQVPCNK